MSTRLSTCYSPHSHVYVESTDNTVALGRLRMSVAAMHGDCREILPTLGAESVNCCVTSPPYWGLRDYGVAGQIGLESTPEAYVAELVAVFREVRRVLRADGTVWLNLGSSYFGNPGGPQGESGQRATRTFTANARAYAGASDRSQSPRQKRAPACGTDGIEPRDLTGAGSACFGLCDGCLADFLSHRGRTADTLQPSEQSAPPLSQTARGSGPTDSSSPFLGASLPDAQASTTLESWLLRRGACSRCDSRASYLSTLGSFGDGARAFYGMSWLDYTRRLKQKDLVPIPWLVAMALQADGWYLRSDIIWAKPNPMPESVTDRPTKAHEYVFLLTKSARYWYDADAIAEPGVTAAKENYPARAKITGRGEQGAAEARGNDRDKSGGFPPRVSDERKELRSDIESRHRSSVPGGQDLRAEPGYTRNARTVWTIATQPFSGAHFATMPPALAERCILAGCPEGGTVLDPFGGAGTTGLVADRLGRNAVLIELNGEYRKMAAGRIQNDAPLFAEVSE